MKIPNVTIQQLLEAGVHLGHKTLRWNPKMKKYIFGKRDSIHIIDLTQTLELTKVALQKVYETISNNGKILFVIPTSYRRKIYDPKSGESVQGEYIQGPIIDILQKNNEKIVCVDLDYSFRGDFSILKERLSESISWFPIEKIVNNLTSKNNKEFIKKYKNLLNDNDFQKIFTYNGIDFWEQLYETLWSLTYSANLPFYIQIIESLNEFFKENRPKAVFLPYETGPMALSIILSCEKFNVKTFGIQHGLILSSNADYSHKLFRTKDSPMGFPLPNKFLLFGNYAKLKLLENSSYPNEKLEIFGNAAYFNLNETLKKLKKNDVKLKYCIPKNKKIILFPTTKSQTHYSKFGRQNYDEQLLKKLLELYSNNENIFVILKPHPSGENTDSYKKMIKSFNCNNFEIKQGSLFELTSVSDLVIAVYSNTLLDTITIGKPTISVNFTGKDFPFKNLDTLITTELENLGNKINNILKTFKLSSKSNI